MIADMKNITFDFHKMSALQTFCEACITKPPHNLRGFIFMEEKLYDKKEVLQLFHALWSFSFAVYSFAFLCFDFQVYFTIRTIQLKQRIF